jgi:hypothetical protein
MSQDTGPDPGSTPKDQGQTDPYTTTSVHTKIRAEDIISDEHWYYYLLKYLDDAVTFYNAGFLDVRLIFPTLCEINPELPP